MVSSKNLEPEKLGVTSKVFDKLNYLIEETINFVNEKNLPLSLHQKKNFIENIEYIMYEGYQKEGRFKNALTFASQDGNEFLVVSDARSFRQIVNESTSDDEINEIRARCFNILETWGNE